MDPSTLPTFGVDTTAAEAASALAPWIKDRTVLITGTSLGGLGYEAVRTIAHQSPRLLILAGRNPANNEAAASAIRSEVPDAKIRLLTLDLGSFTTVRSAAEECLSWGVELDVLVNNAAIMGGPYKKTPDGWEDKFGTNHLGTFLFTNLLVPRMIETARSKAAGDPKPRVVNVSSKGHYRQDINYGDLNWSGGKTYDPLLAYGQSKTGNILFAKALAPKLAKHGITAFSLHPGAIPTNLSRDVTDAEWEVNISRGLVTRDRKPKDSTWVTWKTIETGASTTVVAGFDPRIGGESGGYLDDCVVRTPEGDGERVRAYALDGGNAERLWGVSEGAIREKFEF